MRRASKVDSNQQEVVKKFRELGWSVYITSMVGRGYPDLTIGKFGFCTLCEVKDGTLPPSKRRLTPEQEEFHKNWLGSVIIVQSVNDVIEYDRKFTKRHS